MARRMKRALAILALVACSKSSAPPSIALDDAGVVEVATTNDAAIATVSTDAATIANAPDMDSGAPDAGGPKNSSRCPARARPNMACSEAVLSTECAYPPKTSCVCAMTSCETPAGPVPNCQATAVWMCRDDGCPMVLRGACANEGQRCTADDGMCSSRLVCRNGKWAYTAPSQCRPAAPPQGGGGG